MKKTLSFIALCVAAIVCYGQALQVDGVDYTIDTLQNHQVGPGTDYIQLSMSGGKRHLDVYFLKTDLKNEYVSIRTALGHDSIYTGERPSEVAKRKSVAGARYFAGTNGDFYATTGYVGYPTGVSLIQGELAKKPESARKCFVIDENKRPAIGAFGFAGHIVYKGDQITLHSINHLRGENELKLYNQYNGKTTRTNSYGLEVLVELQDGESWGINREVKVKVLAVEEGKGNMAIPADKAVLSAHGTSAEALSGVGEGDEIVIYLGMTMEGEEPCHYVEAMGGDNRDVLLKDGVLEAVAGWNEYHPRTALGYTQNRDTLIFLVIDGRGISAGATSRGIGQLMLSAGAYTAFNMDGGGSSCMYVEEYGEPVNRGSDGSERSVSNSIFVVSTAPDDEEVAAIQPHEDLVAMPRFGEYTFRFRSYNQYGVLLSSDQPEVVLTCPEEMGTIVGNTFIADGTGDGVITATYRGTVTAQIRVENIPASGVKFRLDSVVVDSRRPYEVEVVAVTADGELPVSSNAMTWTVEDETVCTVEEGMVKALKNGRTKLTGVLDGVSDELLVLVETAEEPSWVNDRMAVSEWHMNASSSLNAQWNETGRPVAWEHGSAVSFVYASGRMPNIRLEKDVRLFGLPDTVKVVLNTGDMVMEKASIGFYANNADDYVVKELTAFKQGGDYSLDVVVSDLFDVNDRGIYPLLLTDMQFDLSSDMTKGKSYVLALKEIVSCYAGVGSGSGVVRPSADTSTQVYPNPVVGDKLFVRMADTSSSVVEAGLYALSGQCVSVSRCMLNNGVAEIPVGALTEGVYLLRLSQNGRTETVKIVK